TLPAAPVVAADVVSDDSELARDNGFTTPFTAVFEIPLVLGSWGPNAGTPVSSSSSSLLSSSSSFFFSTLFTASSSSSSSSPSSSTSSSSESCFSLF
ncbi:hypothetical protein PMAYCL1PPCAC_19761, partial [Pristionchus mayeri]